MASSDDDIIIINSAVSLTRQSAKKLRKMARRGSLTDAEAIEIIERLSLINGDLDALLLEIDS